MGGCPCDSLMRILLSLDAMNKICRIFSEVRVPRNAVTSAFSATCTPHPVLHPSSMSTARASLICISTYVITQKTFCTDFLTKKMKVNEGEVPQYYVEDSHPAIVGEELFDYVQQELQRRKGSRYAASSGCFAGHIFCGDCGSVYGAKVWHSNSKYRRTIWRCNGKYEKGKAPCSTPHFYEEQLREMFVGVMNARMKNKDAIIAAYKSIIQTLTDNEEYKAESASLQGECDVALEMMRKMVRENARAAQDQSEYQRGYGAIVERYDKAKAKLDEVTQTIGHRNAKRAELERFVRILQKRDGLLTAFDEGLWNAVIEKMVVRSASEVVFVFRDGSEIEWKII